MNLISYLKLSPFCTGYNQNIGRGKKISGKLKLKKDNNYFNMRTEATEDKITSIYK